MQNHLRRGLKKDFFVTVFQFFGIILYSNLLEVSAPSASAVSSMPLIHAMMTLVLLEAAIA